MFHKMFQRAGAFMLAACVAFSTVPFSSLQVNASEGIEAVIAGITQPQISMDGKRISMPDAPEGVDVRFCADYKQVIGEDGTIYAPYEDKVVKGFYEVSDGGGKRQSEEFTITVPGKYAPMEGANEKPSVIPELQEWYGIQGQFAVCQTSKIVTDHELLDTAAEFAADYKDLTGIVLPVVEGSYADVSRGDFYLTFDTEDEGLGKEGYILKIGEAAVVEAADRTGAYWGVVSILQILKQTNGTIAKGFVRDYPKYEVRGLSLDVGRKPIEMDTVKQFAKNMSWYKLNSFQVHLNDNLIFFEDYPTMEEAMEKAYAAFRLESDVENEKTGVKLTAEDLFYTKDEFRSFIQDSRKIGVDVIPEFDMPAHALAITRVFDQYMSKVSGGQHKYLIDELDISQDEAIQIAKDIWAEYLEGDDPVFDEETTIHIGTDEFHGGSNGNEAFRKFSDEMIEYIQSTGRKVRMWGSLSNKSGTTPVRSEGVQLNMWANNYADPRTMYNAGYDLINTQYSNLYIVPASNKNRGAYGDYLPTERLYTSWKPNSMGNLTTKAGDEQMLGAVFAIWHDCIDTRANGISEYDSFDRFFDAAPVVAARLWGETEDRTWSEFTEEIKKTGTAPNTNMYYEVDSATKTILKYNFDGELEKDDSANGYDATEKVNVMQSPNGEGGKALRLAGGESYLTTPVDKVGPENSLTVRLKMDANATGEQIICESWKPFGETYGTYSVKARQKGTGKVGYSREGYDYSFNYTLPENEWVELTIKGNQNTAELWVNGSLADKLDTTTIRGTIYKVNTLVMPVGRIGSTTDSFKGEIDFIKVDGKKEIKEDPSVTVTRNFLEKELNKYANLDSSSYTAQSWAKFQELYGKVQAVTGMMEPEQEDYNAAYESLLEMKNVLTETPENIGPDTSELRKEVERLEALDMDAYTQESAMIFLKQLTKAQKALANPMLDSDVSEAMASLEGIEDVLVKRPVVKTGLISEIANAEKQMQNTNEFSAESIAAFRIALAQAKAVLANPDATQKQIDAALKRLKETKLVKKNTSVENPEPKVPAEGTTVTSGGVEYKVTKADAKKGTVTASRLKDTKKAKITIPSEVEIDGFRFQVTAIGSKAFQKGKKLTSVTIGKHVTAIGSGAFYKCSKLKKVVFKGVKAPKAASKAFKGTAAKCKIMAPKKMTKKQFGVLKARLKKAGMSKKALYKK